MKKIFELKENNKALAKKIKEDKVNVKEMQRTGKYCGVWQYQLLKTKHDYRLQHIAYSLLKGKTYEQIEKPKEQNALKEESWEQIEKIKEAYYEENVRLSA